MTLILNGFLNTNLVLLNFSEHSSKYQIHFAIEFLKVCEKMFNFDKSNSISLLINAFYLRALETVKYDKKLEFSKTIFTQIIRTFLKNFVFCNSGANQLTNYDNWEKFFLIKNIEGFESTLINEWSVILEKLSLLFLT